MIDRHRMRDRLLTLGTLAGSGLILFVISVLVGAGDHRIERLGIGIVIAVVGAAVVVLHPGWIYRSLACILGAVPLATIPGLGTPIVLILALAVWCAVLTHPIAETRTSALELSVGLLVLTSLASLIMTVSGIRDVSEFLKWLIATSMVFALLRLGSTELRAVGRWFVYGAFAGATFSLAELFFPPAGAVLDRLAVIGIGRLNAAGTFERLTGTYVEPNAAGIFMLIALTVAVALFRGYGRLILSAVILTALVCTLSRSAIVSVVVAVLFLLIFQPMSTGRRLAVLSGLGVTIASAMAVPVIYQRFMATGSDAGSLDRAESLAEFTTNMTGSWWFGRGWGLAEFLTDADAFNVNHVANSPLLSVYRGGLFVGVAFVGVLIAGVVRAHRNAGRSPWEAGVLGAGFTGFALVGLQLDFPVVTHAPATMAWSLLIALLIANPVGTRQSIGADNADETGRHRSTADA